MLTAVTTSVRPATAADVPRIVAMSLRFLRETPYGGIVRENPDQIATFATALIALPAGVVLVLESAAGVVGMIGLMAVPHYLSGDVIAQEVVWWVDPEARGGGRSLLDAAETWAQQQGAVALHMVAPSERVGRLYQRAGYRFVESAYQKTWS